VAKGAEFFMHGQAVERSTAGFPFCKQGIPFTGRKFADGFVVVERMQGREDNFFRGSIFA